MKALASLLAIAVGWSAMGCGPHCTGNEGPTLATACNAWNNGRYERFPKMCGISGNVGAKTSTWTDADGTCTCDVSREPYTLFYDLNNCSFTTASGTTTMFDLSMSTPTSRDLSSGGGACVDFTSTPPSVSVITAAGTPPTPTGGTLPDGIYQASAVAVYGTSAAPGTQTATFSGQIKVVGSLFETSYQGSSTPAFYGRGTISVSSSTATVSFSCTNTVGVTSASYPYSASGTNVIVTTPMTGYTVVTTYTAM